MADAIATLTVEESWIDLFYTRFKIEVAQERQPALLRALDGYAESLSESSQSLLTRALRRQLGPENWAELIHLATNHETRFYRNPAVIQMVANLASQFGKARILSVGCSTGEEPYSIATELSRINVANFHVHATDVSGPCIAVAKAGVYRANESIGERYAQRIDAGKNMHFYSWLKDLVTFEQHNILGERPIDFFSPNVIVTQNMLIYYRTETRIRILENLACMLAKGGYLITAAAEEAHWKPAGLERIHSQAATVFRKCP